VTTTPGTITITVKSFATLREVMDAQARVDLPGGATVRTLLDRLTRQYPGLDEQIFSAPDTLRDLVNVLRNGRNIAFLAGLDTPLSDGDLVALFPPVAGG
jgi:MoaD family protein